MENKQLKIKLEKIKETQREVANKEIIKFDLYCHKHKYTTKILAGHEDFKACQLCMEEDMDKKNNALYKFWFGKDLIK